MVRVWCHNCVHAGQLDHHIGGLSHPFHPFHLALLVIFKALSMVGGEEVFGSCFVTSLVVHP